MSRDKDLSAFEDDDSSVRRILQGLLSPAPAQALVAPPPDRPAWSGPGESTPVTGSLAAPPSQATPKVSPAPLSFSQQQSAEQSKPGSAVKIRRGLGGFFSHGAGASNVDHRGPAEPPGTRDPIGRLRPIAHAQPIGTRDAQSGRLVMQPTGDPAVNQALATDAMRLYRSSLQAAIENISGAKLVASRDQKNPVRLAEKIALEGQPAQTVSDYGAARIAVDSPQTKDAVIAAVRRRFPVVREIDQFAKGDPEFGYRSYSIQVQMPNAVSEELQIIPKEVFQANRTEHKNYKKARNAQLKGKNPEPHIAAAKAQNDAAMATFDSKNQASLPRLSKGSIVALPDGSRGTVSYLDPNMKIARIRTENGRNVTARLSQLRVEKSLG